MHQVGITLGRPCVIAQAPPDLREWGPYQFPKVERLEDGRLYCSYHVAEDSVAAYGKSRAHAVSEDGGTTWGTLESAPLKSGLLLPDGSRIREKTPAAPDYRTRLVPGCRLCQAVISAHRCDLYEPDLFSQEESGIHYELLPAGGKDWLPMRTDVHLPFAKRTLDGGFLPYFAFSRLRLAPDGALWGLVYADTYREHTARMAALFLVSEDCGRTWSYRSSVYYEPDKTDRHWALCTGFTEPDVAFLPDGSLLCLLRTNDVHHFGPLYQARSTDSGRTWSHPAQFDNLGVWPTLLTLENGVTLAGYGRPGLFLRASRDGEEFDERLKIIPPLKRPQPNTCSYCDMVALSGDTAYLVYTDFEYPNPEGVPVKTVLGRTVRAERSKAI